MAYGDAEYERIRLRDAQREVARLSEENARLKAAVNKLIDYCEDHNWGTMPEPFDSINPLLGLLGRKR